MDWSWLDALAGGTVGGALGLVGSWIGARGARKAVEIQASYNEKQRRRVYLEELYTTICARLKTSILEAIVKRNQNSLSNNQMEELKRLSKDASSLLLNVDDKSIRTTVRETHNIVFDLFLKEPSEEDFDRAKKSVDSLIEILKSSLDGILEAK